MKGKVLVAALVLCAAVGGADAAKGPPPRMRVVPVPPPRLQPIRLVKVEPPRAQTRAARTRITTIDPPRVTPAGHGAEPIPHPAAVDTAPAAGGVRVLTPPVVPPAGPLPPGAVPPPRLQPLKLVTVEPRYMPRTSSVYVASLMRPNPADEAAIRELTAKQQTRGLTAAEAERLRKLRARYPGML